LQNESHPVVNASHVASLALLCDAYGVPPADLEEWLALADWLRLREFGRIANMPAVPDELGHLEDCITGDMKTRTANSKGVLTATTGKFYTPAELHLLGALSLFTDSPALVANRIGQLSKRLNGGLVTKAQEVKRTLAAALAKAKKTQH
jgi:hypothetical protein